MYFITKVFSIQSIFVKNIENLKISQMYRQYLETKFRIKVILN